MFLFGLNQKLSFIWLIEINYLLVKNVLVSLIAFKLFLYKNTYFIVLTQ